MGEDTNKRLVLVAQELGLTYNSSVALVARYETSTGVAIRGGEVRFALVATSPGESTAGATLSSTVVESDEAGQARVQLVAGAQDARFRISVAAKDAPTQYLYASVSEGGFASLYITPRHEGWRSAADFERIEVRLYPSQQATCASLDVDALPESAFPPRSLDGFGGAVEYRFLNARTPHTVLAWSLIPGSETPVAAGCMDLDAAQLPTSRVNIDILVGDRALRFPAQVTLSSVLDLGPVAEAIAAQGATWAWDVLACPAGPGQLALDCAVDAVAPDGALDCEVHGASTLLTAIESRRGATLASGCRPDVDQSGMVSLDRLLSDAIAAGDSWSMGAGPGSLVASRAAITTSLELDSVLSMLAPGAAQHRLVAARVVLGDVAHTVDMAASSRPVIEQRQVPAAVQGNVLELGTHGFTLRYGAIAAAAFAELGLASAGLPPDPAAVGSALVAALAADGSVDSGCELLSAEVCSEVGRAAACLVNACEAALPAMDQALAAWWRAAAVTGQDLVLTGTATLHDADGDLVVDAIGRSPDGDGDGESSGQWSGSMTLASGASAPVRGEF